MIRFETGGSAKGGEPMTSPDKGPTIERQIGGTKFIVTSTYARNASETAVQKMQRLILKDAEKVMKVRK